MKKLDDLVAAFNRGSLDVPDGFLTPNTTFSLNGRPYESLLGGSADDPLIRLLARGSAGYRTAAKALHYALQQPALTVESISNADAAGLSLAKLRVEGRLRGSAVRRAVAAEDRVPQGRARFGRRCLPGRRSPKNHGRPKTALKGCATDVVIALKTVNYSGGTGL